MTPKPVRRRAVARRDVERAADHYLRAGGLPLALRFLDRVAVAVHHIARYPAAGSLRYAGSAGLPQLRFWPGRDFPYLIFYVELKGRVDVWRVLHAERDLPASLRPED